MTPVSDAREPDGPQVGELVDPEIISERRSRRVEVGDSALRERARQAEAQLAQARSELAAAHDQRAELAAQLRRTERDLRAARQGEHAEAARRAELEEDAADARREAVRDLAAMRADLAAAEQRVLELEDELAEAELHATNVERHGGAEQRRVEIEAVVARERATVESQLTLVREGVVTLRERLAADAEARAVLDDEIRASLEAVRAELAEVRSAGDERAAGTRRLEERVDELVASLAVSPAELGQPAPEVDDVPGRVADASTLEAERLARHAAEDALERERDRVHERERSVVELENQLEQARVALRQPASMPPADHPALVPATGKDAGPAGSSSDAAGVDSVIIDLARAASRLRMRGEDEGHVAEPPEVEAEVEVEIGPRLSPIGRPVPRAWLTPSIMALGRTDADGAVSVIAALAPVQAARLRQDLTYDIVVTGHSALRVRLREDGTGTVGPCGEEDAGADPAAFRLTGSAVALAPYAGGGLGRRRPRDVVVAGGKRRARRLARALKDPVSLHAVAALGAPLSPATLLALLTAAIDPAQTRGEHFTVAFVAGEDAGAVVRVVIADGAPLVVTVDESAHPDATVRTSARGLAGFLGGSASARVSGDAAVVRRLLGWADAAQTRGA